MTLIGRGRFDDASAAAPSVLVVDHAWSRFDEVLALYYEVLYRDFGVDRDADWYQPAHGSEFAVAIAADRGLLGAARLLPAPGDTERQVRQVAVAPGARGSGVGRVLMGELHAIAAREGAETTWLHARETAFGFYESLGYRYESEPFASSLTGIPHRTMRRAIVASDSPEPSAR